MEVNIKTYIFVIFFGSASWLSTNSVWMQLPLLTDHQPEKWNLPSYLAAIIQLACVGPLIYSILLKWYKIKIPTASIILILLIFSCICLALLAFFWSNTFHVFGQNRSVVLMALMFGLALVNTSSSVLFMPYMAIFHPSYLTAYFIGMSFSALYPSTVSMIQGAGDECEVYNGSMIRVKGEPLFGIREYYLLMLAWMILATVAFLLLHLSSSAPRGGSATGLEHSVIPISADETAPLRDINYHSTAVGISNYSNQFSLLFIVVFINAQMNGIVPSIQSFATLPYSQVTYRLALTLGNIFSPIGSFLPLFLTVKSPKIIWFLTLVVTCLTTYLLVLAIMSPATLLKFSVLGKLICIVVAVTLSLLLSYLRTVLTTLIRRGGKNEESQLFWSGVAIQVGSFIGMCIMFPLVNIFHIFKSEPLCSNDDLVVADR